MIADELRRNTYQGTREDAVRYFLVHGHSDEVTFGRASNIFNDVVRERDDLRSRLLAAEEHSAELERVLTNLGIAVNAGGSGGPAGSEAE